MRRNPRLTQLARELRRNMTDAERRLWQHLRAHRLGPHFRRQTPIGPYIVDFVCQALMLIIELDGGHHADQVAEDALRTAWLASRGYTVLRYWNHDVLNRTDAVVADIHRRLTPLPDPPDVIGPFGARAGGAG